MKKLILFLLMCLVFASCQKNLKDISPSQNLISAKNENNGAWKTSDVLYIQTNDFHENRNAVLAYRLVGGILQPFGGPFYTKGSGVADPMQKLGPLDSDYELRISSDKKFLLAVNSGSNTIAVFYIKPDGALQHVPGSPFHSGGQTPVSIDVWGNKVFVVNKSDDPLHHITQAPNYTTFTMDDNGYLTPVPGAKFKTTPGVSATQNLVSRDGKYLFGDDFLAFTLMPPVGTLRSFAINNSGTLTPVPGTPYTIPALLPGKPAGGALGLWEHPSGTALYAGFPAQGKIGVYAINSTNGALTFQTAVDGGKASCWIRTTKDGNYMYVLNSGENTVSVFNSSNPLSPVFLQKIELKNSGPNYTLLPNGKDLKTSEDFSLALSTSEKVLYIVNQYTNPNFSFGNYNYLHYLNVGDNDLLTEDTSPIQIPVPNTVRPKGSAVISLNRN